MENESPVDAPDKILVLVTAENCFVCKNFVQTGTERFSTFFDIHKISEKGWFSEIFHIHFVSVTGEPRFAKIERWAGETTPQEGSEATPKEGSEEWQTQTEFYIPASQFSSILRSFPDCLVFSKGKFEESEWARDPMKKYGKSIGM